MNVGGVIKKISRGNMNFVPPGGNSYVSIQDVVQAHLLAMEKGKTGDNYIISSCNISYRELFDKISNISGTRPVKWDLPNWSYPPLIVYVNAVENILSLLKRKTPLPAPSYPFRYSPAATTPPP